MIRGRNEDTEGSTLTPGFETLQRLAALAANGPANRPWLAHIADTLRDASGADQVCFVYAEDRDWVTCGDSRCGDDIGTGKTGLWLIQQAAQQRNAPVAFNIRGKRVGDFVLARGAKGREFIATRIPTSESPSEMVIVRGPWKVGIKPALLKFMDAARPSLVIFLERVLNAARADRQRGQKSALANAAEVLTKDEDTQSVLENLATAMSNTTGYELVTIDLWDEASQKITSRALNGHRWQDTSLGHTWTDPSGLDLDATAGESARTRQPMLMPDIQNDTRCSEDARHFFKWIMLVSAIRVPIIFRDKALGSISFASWKPHTFPPEEVEALKGLAAQLAVGLEAMQMYKALAESREQLEKYAKQLQENTEIEHRLARTDALTGIPNRRYVEEVVDAEHARALRHGRSLSVGLLDVDKLKSVNDEYGHDAGDEILMQLAQLARRSCRKGDVVGRYGGDEFLFVLPEANLQAALRFGERFRNKVEKRPFHLPKGGKLSLKVSLGIAEADSAAAHQAPDLVASADAALYRAKSVGGNSVCFEGAASAA
jgi:diguanylate cyclase (GGDEF)-like protein